MHFTSKCCNNLTPPCSYYPTTHLIWVHLVFPLDILKSV
uniref:Uncharacterized protein n=1 Tax=Rhizophora mucronata TaxID=61149 RepID=A0A2P2QB64_RHIMU